MYKGWLDIVWIICGCLNVAYLLRLKECPSLAPPFYAKNQLALNVWLSSLTRKVREAINASPSMRRVKGPLNTVIPNILLIRQLLASHIGKGSDLVLDNGLTIQCSYKNGPKSLIWAWVSDPYKKDYLS
jgi:hypothetical protein